jgi:hypothetical protein
MLEQKSIIKLQIFGGRYSMVELNDSTKTEIYRLRNAGRNDSIKNYF